MTGHERQSPGFIGGLVLDLYLESPLGLSALVFAIVGYGVASFERGVIRADRWLQPAVAGVAERRLACSA